jgi:ATP-dependent RNA helicase DDX35
MSHSRPPAIFLKPNNNEIIQTSINVERLSEIETEKELAKYNANSDLSIEVQRQQLPIFKSRNQILYALETHRILVLVGETGSGKS